ncbi:O-antigen ligase family protein [Serratia marcescens]|nr:O-antigen ligase family protein [Serratia marcescens]
MVFDRILFLFAFLLLIPSAIYIPNPGCVELVQPFNLLFAAGSALLMAACWRSVLLRRVVITPTCRALALAFALLALPVLFTRPEWQSAALWRLAALCAGVAFYFTWLQVRMTARQRHQVLYMILLTALVQAVMVLLQLFVPNTADAWVSPGTSPAFGIFQAPNVTASFLATGLALALAAFALPGFRMAQPNAERWRRRLLAACLMLLSAVVVLVQSLAGWLSGGLVVLLFVICFYRRVSQTVMRALALVVTGAGVAVLVLMFGDSGSGTLQYNDPAGSIHTRYTVLHDTLAMIIQKPLLGWGYGGFEYSFQHFRVTQTPATVLGEIVRHPHSELLLWWVEGGLVALLGILVLFRAGVTVVVRARWRDRLMWAGHKAAAGEALALCLALLPMVLYTQPDSPFYLSTLHWLVFLLLAAMLDRMVSRRLGPAISLKGWRYPILGLALAMLFMAGAGFYSGQVLKLAERDGGRDRQQAEPLPGWINWIHTERMAFDCQQAALREFNHTGDEQLLESYAQWAQLYLSKHVDKNVYANLLTILRRQQQFVRADELRREAAQLFPYDRRFTRYGF